MFHQNHWILSELRILRDLYSLIYLKGKGKNIYVNRGKGSIHFKKISAQITLAQAHNKASSYEVHTHTEIIILH